MSDADAKGELYSLLEENPDLELDSALSVLGMVTGRPISTPGPKLQTASCGKDDGINFFSKGRAEQTLIKDGQAQRVIRSDRCEGSKLFEYYCAGTSLSVKTTNCLYGCSNGACLRQAQPRGSSQTCSPSSACDDSNLVKTNPDCSTSSTPCQYGCSSGACNPGQPGCEPQTACQGSSLVTIAEDCSTSTFNCQSGCTDGECNHEPLAPPIQACAPASTCHDKYLIMTNGDCTSERIFCQFGCTQFGEDGSCRSAPKCLETAYCSGSSAVAIKSDCTKTQRYCILGCSVGSCKTTSGGATP